MRRYGFVFKPASRISREAVPYFLARATEELPRSFFVRRFGSHPRVECWSQWQRDGDDPVAPAIALELDPFLTRDPIPGLFCAAAVIEYRGVSLPFPPGNVNTGYLSGSWPLQYKAPSGSITVMLNGFPSEKSVSVAVVLEEADCPVRYRKALTSAYRDLEGMLRRAVAEEKRTRELLGLVSALRIPASGQMYGRRYWSII